MKSNIALSLLFIIGTQTATTHASSTVYQTVKNALAKNPYSYAINAGLILSSAYMLYRPYHLFITTNKTYDKKNDGFVGHRNVTEIVPFKSLYSVKRAAARALSAGATRVYMKRRRFNLLSCTFEYTYHEISKNNDGDLFFTSLSNKDPKIDTTIDELRVW